MFELGRNNPLILWKPVIEKDFGQERFLTEDPVRAYQNGDFAKIPIITGMTKDEFVGPAISKLAEYLASNLISNISIIICRSLTKSTIGSNFKSKF